MSLLRSSSTIGLLTLVSRILGFMRDVLMARFLGAGMAADAFLVAFRLPNLFRALFAEGAFSAAFVPLFNRKLALEDGRSEARRFAEDVLAVLLPVLVILTAIVMIAAAPVVWAMTGGFNSDDPRKFALAVELSRITFPYLAFISLASLFGGILNSLGRFAAAAAAPILLNLCLIAALLLWGGSDNIATARGQAVAVTVAGLLQLILLIYAARREGVRIGVKRPRWTPDVKALVALVLPAALGAGAVQINLLVSTLLAARFLPEGSISYLYYADRLVQLPLGLVGIGVGTALLPLLARHIAAGRDDAAIHHQNRALQIVMLLTLPAAAGLAVIAEPIVTALLRHGEFSAGDAAATALTLAAFATGLPAFVLIKVVAPGFHARGDTKTPVRVATWSILVNLGLNLILIWNLAQVGLALSTAAAAWFNALSLYIILRRRGQFAMDDRVKHVLPRALGAALLMILFLAFAQGPLMASAGTDLLGRIAGLSALIAGGAAVYGAGIFGLRAVSPSELREQLKRGRKAG